MMMENVEIDIVKNALTLSEAMLICSNNQHLHGKRVITANGEGEVARVVVAPADDINKWIFLQRFIETTDPVKALEFYKVPYYDVVLVIQLPGNNISSVSLRSPDCPVIL